MQCLKPAWKAEEFLRKNKCEEGGREGSIRVQKGTDIYSMTLHAHGFREGVGAGRAPLAGKEQCQRSALSPTFREPGRRYSPSPLSSQQLFADGSDDGISKLET